MNKQRPIPFRSLTVQRPPVAERPASPAAPVRARASFSDMLRRGSGTAAPADARGMREASVVPLAFAGYDDRFDAASDDDEDGQPEPDEAQAPEDDADAWAVPSPETLESLLAQAVPATSDRRQAPPQIRSLASTIAGFCNERAVSDSEGWNVRIQLRPDVVADTTLDLTVSAHWLQLRFHAGQPASRRLLYENETSLREQLSQCLDRSREIAIDID